MRWFAVIAPVLAAAINVAQVPSPDPLGGGSGWVGAGLLGVVLAWLMLKNIPDKDRQTKEFLESKDRQLREIIDAKDTAFTKIIEAKDLAFQKLLSEKDKQLNDSLVHKWTVIEAMGNQYKTSLEKVTEHCEKEVNLMTTSWGRDIGELTKAMQDLSEIVSRFSYQKNERT